MPHSLRVRRRTVPDVQQCLRPGLEIIDEDVRHRIGGPRLGIGLSIHGGLGLGEIESQEKICDRAFIEPIKGQFATVG
jgi:hypothetical protein